MKISKSMISGGLIGGMLAAPISAAIFGNRDIILRLYYAIFSPLDVEMPFGSAFRFPFYVFFTQTFTARNIPSLIAGFVTGLVLGAVLARYVESEDAKPDPLWISTKKKVRSFLLMAAAILITTLPYSLLSILVLPLLLFPMGLTSWVNGVDTPPTIVVLIWIVYALLAVPIFLTKRKKMIVALYVALIILLIFNVAGCHVIAPDMLQGLSGIQ